MKDLWVDPEGLKRSAKGFTEGSRDLAQTHERLAGALAAEGRCWGTDKVGKEFEADYLQPSQGALRMFGRLVEGLSSIKAGLDEMAETHEAAEDRSTSTVNRVGREV
jgi:uncharacterized protein YukE